VFCPCFRSAILRHYAGKSPRPRRGARAVARVGNLFLPTPDMPNRLAALLVVAMLPGAALLGCVTPHPGYEPVPVAYQNPVPIPVTNYELVWDGVRDVVADYFRIQRVEPVRLIGNTLTEGRIDTYPMPGATLLEPWFHDSANDYERLESTLQSIR